MLGCPFATRLSLRVCILTVMICVLTVRSQVCEPGESQCMNEEKCIPIDYVCDGIPDCVAGTEEVNCTSAGGCVAGESRLIGGVTKSEGLLETCFSGIYRPVSVGGFTVLEASTVCRQLDQPAGGLPVASETEFHFSSVVGFLGSVLLSVNCQGGESNLTDCTILASNTPLENSRQAGVRCMTDALNCSNGEVRLAVGSPSEREGRVEVCYEGVWGSVTDNSWSHQDAAVVCQQLNFEAIGAMPMSPSLYPGAPIPPILEGPVCNGTESSLLECDSFTPLGSVPLETNGRSLVGVKCDVYAGSGCSDLESRLINRDRTGLQGQLQICDASRDPDVVWSTACSTLFDQNDADVVCRQLNPSSGSGSHFFTSSILPRDSAPVFDRDLPCAGSEQNLTDCFSGCLNNSCGLTGLCCNISDSDSVQEAQCTVMGVVVNCADLPIIYFSPPSLNGIYVVELGRPFAVNCSYIDDIFPPLDVVLSSGGNSTEDASIQVFRTGFGGIKREDAGMYSCRACVVNATSKFALPIIIEVLAPAPDEPAASSTFLRFSLPRSDQDNIDSDVAIRVLNAISVDYPGVQTVDCTLILTQPIDVERDLDRFQCAISEFATVAEDPPSITAREIATAAVAVLVRTTAAALIEISDFTDLDTELDMLVNDVTEDNFEVVVDELAPLVENSVMMVEEQTEDNLDRIAAVFDSVATLAANSTLPIANDTVIGLVDVLNSITQWDAAVLAASGSNIIQDFETIVAMFADQSNGIEITRSDIAFLAENLELDVLRNNGRRFSSSSVDGSPPVPNTGDGLDVPATLTPSQTGFINLPPSLFGSVPDNLTTVGLFFVVYENPSLFPVTEPSVENSSRVIKVFSSVLGATVGPGLSFVSLEDPVSISLRLQDRGRNESAVFGFERCVSWDFSANGGEGAWTTAGCETVSSVDGVVSCECNHLTNFAILVDICSRVNAADCGQPPAISNTLKALTIIGVVLSLFGLVVTIVTLIVFKKLRERDASKYHVQLCLAMICMLLVFVAGINRTAVYGGCVLVSVLIHYFTLVAVLWMSAEALLMFQKFVVVFVRITTKFIVIISILCWSLPLIPVIIPLIVDLSTRPDQDIVVNRENFCFLNHPGAFFGAFLAPIFALVLFNVVVFVCVVVILARHTKVSIEHQPDGMKKKAVTHFLISIAGVMFLFGLTWLFGAFTITVTAVNLLFQILFVVFNSLQGFFFFLFFCVFSKEARESWKEVLSCWRYKSEFLHPSHSVAMKHQSANAGPVGTTFTQDKLEIPMSDTEGIGAEVLVSGVETSEGAPQSTESNM